MEHFTKEKVQKLAKLARIDISQNNIEQYIENLTDIFNEIEKLKSVDTAQIKPIANIMQQEIQLRRDVVEDLNDLDDIMSNSPKKELNCYVVPKVIE